MQSNLTVTPYRPSFGIKTSNNLINRTSLLCTNTSNTGLYDKFLNKVKQLESKGFQDYTIDYKLLPKSRNKNERHVLYAYKNGSNPQESIVIAHNSKFSHTLQEYLNINGDSLVKLIKSK
jgi:hypothetical protein